MSLAPTRKQPTPEATAPSVRATAAAAGSTAAASTEAAKKISFAAAILKGNNAPPPPPPVKKPVIAAAAAPAAAAPTNAKKQKQNTPKPPKEEKPEKIIPLTAGSAWAQKLSVGTAAVKPAAPAAAAKEGKEAKGKKADTQANTHTADSNSTTETTITAAAPISTSTPAASVVPPAAAPAAATSAPSTAPQPVTAAPSTPIVTAAPAPVVVVESTPLAADSKPAAPSVPVTAAPTSFAAALRAKLPVQPAAAVIVATENNATNNTKPAPAPRLRKKAATAAAKKEHKPTAAAVATAPNAAAAPAPAADTTTTPQTATTTATPAAAQPAAASTPAPVTVTVAAATSTAAPAAVTVAAAAAQTPKFGLVETTKRGSISNPTNTHHASGPRKEFKADHARDAGYQHGYQHGMPQHYTPYPLSPYQLFLLDPRTGAVCASMSALNNVTGQLEELSGAPVDAVPLLLIPSPTGGPAELAPLCELVAQQLSFYFSVDNLVRDVFLRGRMGPRGYIPLQELLTFPRIRALTSSTYYLTIAAKGCMQPQPQSQVPPTDAPKALFKVKNGGLRLRGDWHKFVFPRPAAEDINESSDEEETEKNNTRKTNA